MVVMSDHTFASVLHEIVADMEPVLASNITMIVERFSKRKKGSGTHRQVLAAGMRSFPLAPTLEQGEVQS
jgi:hypothetical protein